MQEEKTGAQRPICLGVLIANGNKNTWSNTFECMCENYYNEVCVGIRENALRHRCTLVVERIVTVGNATQQPAMLRAGMVDGVIVVGGMFNMSLISMLQNKGVPSVVVGCDVPDMDCVTSDYSKGVYMAIRYLLEAGHRDILYISGPERTRTSGLKDRGYQKALAEYAMQPAPKHYVHSEFSGEGGYWATKTAFEINDLHPRRSLRPATPSRPVCWDICTNKKSVCRRMCPWSAMSAVC